MPNIMSNMDAVVTCARQFMDAERQPQQLSSEVAHEYVDKFLSVKFMQHAAVHAALVVLGEIGIDSGMLQTIGTERRQRKQSTPVFLKLQSTIVPAPAAVPSATRMETVAEYQTTKSGGGARTQTTKQSVGVPVKEYFWDVAVNWTMVLGSDSHSTTTENTLFVTRIYTGESRITKRDLSPPNNQLPQATTSSLPLDVTWLIDQLPDAGSNKIVPRFDIDRSRRESTPRRNPESKRAEEFWQSWSAWCESAHDRLRLLLPHMTSSPMAGVPLLWKVEDIPIPVAPLVAWSATTPTSVSSVQPTVATTASASASAVVDSKQQIIKSPPSKLAPWPTDKVSARAYIKEKKSDLKTSIWADADLLYDIIELAELSHEEVKDLGRELPFDVSVWLETKKPGGKQKLVVPFDILEQLIGQNRRLVKDKRGTNVDDMKSPGVGFRFSLFATPLFDYAAHIGLAVADGMCKIERDMTTQLISAIGSVISVDKFAKYANGCLGTMMRREYAPKPFSHLVRVAPTEPTAVAPAADGHLQLESRGDDNKWTPVYTTSHVLPERKMEMSFDVNAPTQIEFTGTRHIHGWMNHQFSDQHTHTLRVTATSNTCSAYVLQMGRVLSDTQFKVEHSILLRNRDDLHILLSVATLPTNQEFRDKIGSLSPEQKLFASQFRDYQLSSTVFGILVIPIIPAIERALNLPARALDQELELKNHLLELFEKQIPCTLLAYKPPTSSGGNVLDPIATVKANVANVQTSIQRQAKEMLSKKKLDRAMDGASGGKGGGDSDGEDFPPALERSGTGTAAPTWGLGAVNDFDAKAAPTFSFGAPAAAAAAPAPMVRHTAASTTKRVAVAASSNAMFAFAASAPAAAALSTGFGDPFHPTDTFDFGFGASVDPSRSKPVDPPSKQTSAPGFGAPSDGGDRHSSATTRYTKMDETLASQGRDIKVDTKQSDFTSGGGEQSNLVELDIAGVQERVQARLATVPGNALRPTIINVSSSWIRQSTPLVGSVPPKEPLSLETQEKAHRAVQSLLCVLSNDGAIPLAHTRLDIIVGVTSYFDKSVIDTVIQDNINPLDRVCSSSLLLSNALRRLTQPSSTELELVQSSKTRMAAQLLSLTLPT